MKTQNKLSVHIRRLIEEAIRRYVKFHAGEPIENVWIGLGTEANYRPAIDAGLMTWHNGKQPPPRCDGWLILTPKGEKVFLSMLAQIVRERLE